MPESVFQQVEQCLINKITGQILIIGLHDGYGHVQNLINQINI